MVKAKKRILSITIAYEVDQDPDLSFLGRYSSCPNSPAAIDRKSRGCQERNEYRYFIPAMNAEETGNPDSPEQDFQRMEAYNRQEWQMLGIHAVAQVVTGEVVQTIRSGGLWGFESDSDKAYFKEVEENELHDLSAELEAVGFSKASVRRALAKVSRKD